MSKWTLKVEEDGEDCILVFPEEMMKELGWQEGDTIRWDLTDGEQSATLVNESADARKQGKIFGPGVNEWHGVANPNLTVINKE